MRKIKTTSFNLSDEYEKKLLEHALLKKHGGYSKYIKRLITRDLEGWEQRTMVPFIETSTIDEVGNDFSGFI